MHSLCRHAALLADQCDQRHDLTEKPDKNAQAFENGLRLLQVAGRGGRAVSKEKENALTERIIRERPVSTSRNHHQD